MAFKTSPEQITESDRQLVKDFIRDSKAAGYDPTMTTIVFNKAKSDPKVARKIAKLQGRKPSGKEDAGRAERSRRAREEARRAGREAKAIRDEGGYLTGKEWAKMAGEMLLTVAGGAGLNLALKGAGVAAKGSQALMRGAKARKLLRGGGKKQLPKGGPKQLSQSKTKQLTQGGRHRLQEGGKHRLKEGSPPPPANLSPAEIRSWVAKQELQKRTNLRSRFREELKEAITGKRAKAMLKELGEAGGLSRMKAGDAIAKIRKLVGK